MNVLLGYCWLYIGYGYIIGPGQHCGLFIWLLLAIPYPNAVPAKPPTINGAKNGPKNLSSCVIGYMDCPFS